MELLNKKILLGITGGVAAFKACYLARELMRQGASVQVVMTEAATHFITPVTFQALTGNPVFTNQWDNRIANNMAHIELSRDADAIVIAPASADFIAKLVQGRADDLLSTLCLARNRETTPFLVAPAMNREMWSNPATQRNVQQAAKDGIVFSGPGSGDQACGETGDGRMLEAEDIAEHVIALLTPKALAGLSVLLTAGPTFEPIDPVRGITNLSSGKQGFALARACWMAGAKVTLVAGPSALPDPLGITTRRVQTAQQMFDAVMAEVSHKPNVFIAVAAVADWRVANASQHKLKKNGSGDTPKLEFAVNPDILATVAKLNNAPYCVGFAAESEDLLKNAQEKRLRKNVPLLVANIGHATFGKDENELLLVDEKGHSTLARTSKTELANKLVKEIAKRLSHES
jgi:phosphopantothenoylcysteine decarboxylase / phosphopantothenate---cysteine ligase